MNKIISFDIWDTIIKRKCHPEEVKLHTAKYIYLKYNNKLKNEYKDIYMILKTRNVIEEKMCKENEKNGNDAECKIIDVFNRLKQEIFKDTSNLSNLSNELLTVEIEQEKKVIYLNPDIVPIFETYKNLKAYCISDFYMSSESLMELLKYLKIDDKIEKIYSSADFLLNKKSGKLFSKVEQELNVLPEKHLHVGDNEYSDIEIPSKLGIQTIKIKKENIEFIPEANRKIDFQLEKLQKKENCLNDKLFNIGVQLSPLIYFFVYSIIEHTIKNNINNVYYCTREGETFIKVHELMQKNNPFGIDLPSPNILEVSRMETFSASLEELSIQELLRLWSQYRNQSMSALFKTLGIEIEQYKKYFEKYKIKINKTIQSPWFDVNVQSLFRDDEFCNDVNKQIKLKREELLEYFNKTKKMQSNEIFTVDIGWRGTIQDNLAYIFQDKKIIGYYLALYDFYNIQPENTEKFSFISDKNIRDNYVSPLITLLEWIYNPGTASVTGYKDGKPVRKAKIDERDVVKTYVLPMQQGMMAGAEKINEYIRIHPFQTEEVKIYVYDLLKKVKEKPNKVLVNMYYSMVFNDTFGTGEYIEKNNKIGIITRINPIKCRRLLLKENWKEAFIKYNNINYINIIFYIKQKISKMSRGN